MEENPQDMEAIADREEARSALNEALAEVKRVIVGQDEMLERLLVSRPPVVSGSARRAIVPLGSPSSSSASAARMSVGVSV